MSVCSQLFLAKTAKRVCIGRNPTAPGLTDEDRNFSVGYCHPNTLDWGMDLVDRFTAEEAAAVWAEFRALEQALTLPEAQTAAGFETERGRDKGTRSALEVVPAEAMRVAARMLGSGPPAPRL